MATFQDIINLSKADGGKFFVIDESGDIKLVVMSVEEYQKLLLGKLQKQMMDVEEINRKILKAQLEDVSGVKLAPPPVPSPTKVSNSTSKVDLREEVIDPSFDFEGPKVDLDDF